MLLFLTREIRFSSDAGTAADAEVANTWAGWPAADGLAPYLRLRATLAGHPDPATGYLCDIKDIDDLLQITAVPLAAASLPGDQRPCHPAYLLRTIWQRLPEQPLPGARLVRLELRPTPYVIFTMDRDHPDMIQYTEQFEFAASHRLHCPEWTEQHNRDVFGKCNNPNGHGHNYVVEVTVDAAGFTANPPRRHLGRIVKEQVLDRFDHKHLNLDTAEFRDLNPTVENITGVVWRLLAEPLRPLRLLAVRVYETPKTWAECRGE